MTSSVASCGTYIFTDRSLSRCCRHVFGHIPGIRVGTHWESRQACSLDRVHGPLMAGIHGTKDEGAYSIALSGSYSDDEDNGETFIYTGAGGRARYAEGKDGMLKRLRVGPQVEDQTWDDWGNRSLLVSMETKLPIRVIRSARLSSMYAPTEGMYRYDGLYIVTRAWQEKGKEHKLVCRYQFERLPGQPPLFVARRVSPPKPLQMVPIERIPRKRSLPFAGNGRDEEPATKKKAFPVTTPVIASNSNSGVNVKPFSVLSTLKFTKVRSESS
ncbi:hypothetical protein SERLADRAFT_468011 [Serpula lacrymans var. lacrymans S7.9]|uniref:YDG domain-containing protein n=1 Tax=Serpula lacrymans var. lacrymans (strain S7.9) TaxID=578457 RepID=F8NX62_SERL9|nr:uncharacterized protein SERLADRAFT_468011 [Serpula lacrymans var. lacrymans S7.9]EGO24537.1 hypothetical protein SERLADRAFT_468011 [Serpula lacrymans var. lacrymans S7.9]